jgi:protein-L-isoaspartate(D-aspartate) O-methyltransferase
MDPTYDPHELDEKRRAMVEQLTSRGIRDQRVLRAFESVLRERYVPEELASRAYADSPQPIGYEQTISQPYIVAVMIEALSLAPNDRVLEIGTGSGYSTALLATIAADVVTVERIGELADTARRRLAREGFTVEVHEGDGTLGWPERAPYDAIVVWAAGPIVPRPLVAQLAMGGRMVLPVRTDGDQVLLLLERTPEGLRSDVLEDVRFVPLIGEQGEPESSRRL